MNVTEDSKNGWVLSLGAALIVGGVVYFALKPSGNEVDASEAGQMKLLLSNTRVREATDYAFEEIGGGLSALEWIMGQQRLGFLVGYDKKGGGGGAYGGKFRFGRFTSAKAMADEGMMPVPSYAAPLANASTLKV